MGLRVCSLVSGSSGNAYLAESPEGPVLIDAGVSVKGLRALCAERSVNPARLRAIIVTHDHSDHCRGAGAVHRAFRCPLAMSAGTWAAAALRAGKVAAPLLVRDGSVLNVAGMRLRFHATPHDGREPLCVVVERGGKRCGILTDLGHPFDGLGALLSGLDAVFLESNYSEPLLAANREYPPPLKNRIRGPGGHLENRETGALLRDHAGERTRLVVLSHLSRENNSPERARAEVEAVAASTLTAAGISLHVAPRYSPSPFFVIA